MSLLRNLLLASGAVYPASVGLTTNGVTLHASHTTMIIDPAPVTVSSVDVTMQANASPTAFALAIDPASLAVTTVDAGLVKFPTTQVPEDGTYYQGGVPSAITPTVVVTDGYIYNVTPGLAGTAQKSRTSILTASTAHRYAKYTFTSVATNDFSMLFHVDKETLAMTAGATANLLAGFMSSVVGTRLSVRLLYDGTVGFRIRITLKNDANADQNSAYTTIGASWPAYLRLHVHRATNGTGANDGFARIYFPGSTTPDVEMASVDIFDHFSFNEIWLGQSAGFSSAATATGTISFDEVKFSDGTFTGAIYGLTIDPAAVALTAVDLTIQTSEAPNAYALTVDPASVSITPIDALFDAVMRCYPNADIQDGGWLNELATNTDLFESVNELYAPNDSDYIESSLTTGVDACELALANVGGTPQTGTVTLRVRHQLVSN